MAETKTTKTTEKTVKIKIPLTHTDKEPAIVKINGHRYAIKRGVYVEVPESVAEILERNDKRKEKAIRFEEENNKTDE